MSRANDISQSPSNPTTIGCHLDLSPLYGRVVHLGKLPHTNSPALDVSTTGIVRGSRMGADGQPQVVVAFGDGRTVLHDLGELDLFEATLEFKSAILRHNLNAMRYEDDVRRAPADRSSFLNNAFITISLESIRP